MSTPSDTVKNSESASDLIHLSVPMEEQTANRLVDLFCSNLSQGSADVYQDILQQALLQGADAISARQSALYQACLHESMIQAIEASVSNQQSSK